MSAVHMADLGPAAQAHVRAQLAAQRGGDRTPGRAPLATVAGVAPRKAPAVECLPAVLVLPFPPALSNATGAGRGGIAQHQARTRYLERCALRLALRQLPAPPATPWAHATLTIAAVVARTHDLDNLTGRMKPAVDFLRTRWIVDDDPAHLTWAGLPTQRVKRRGEMPHICLTLTPAPHPHPAAPAAHPGRSA